MVEGDSIPWRDMRGPRDAGCGAVEALRQAGYWIDFRGMVAKLSPWQSTEEDDSKEDFSV